MILLYKYNFLLHDHNYHNYIHKTIIYCRTQLTGHWVADVKG